MKKDNYGHWEITVPPKAPGVCAIPHDSKIKVQSFVPSVMRAYLRQISMIIPSGERIERLPAWITRVTQDIQVSPVYDARFWNPPDSERYTFKNPRPAQPKSTRIYEAHVGISTTEARVGTYKEFTANILPRIKNLGYNVIQLMAIMEHAYYACWFHLSLAFFALICFKLSVTK